MQKPDIVMDVPHLLQAMQNSPGIEATCHKLNIKAPPHTSVRMWRSRGQIPGAWWPTVLQCADVNGINVLNYVMSNDTSTPDVDDLF